MKKYLLLLSLVVSNSFAQNVSSNMTATSTLSATCSISANSINFATLLLPLSAQSSSGSISYYVANKLLILLI